MIYLVLFRKVFPSFFPDSLLSLCVLFQVVEFFSLIKSRPFRSVVFVVRVPKVYFHRKVGIEITFGDYLVSWTILYLLLEFPPTSMSPYVSD